MAALRGRRTDTNVELEGHYLKQHRHVRWAGGVWRLVLGVQGLDVAADVLEELVLARQLSVALEMVGYLREVVT